MRVLLVSPYNAKRVGGIGTWSKSILDYSWDSDEQVEIIFQNTANGLKRYLNGSRFRRVLIGVEDTFVIWIRLIWNLLTKHIDVVHYTSSASLALNKDKLSLLIVKSLFHKRFIIHWHFGRIPEICDLHNGEYKQLINIINNADASIVLDGKSLKALISQGCKNVYYIPNPLSAEVYDAAHNIDVRALFDCRNEGEVLFVGHIIRNKGVFELVRACVDIPMVKKLIMVGPSLPEIKNELLSIAKKRGSVGWLEFKGEVPREDVFKYYSRCSIFCLPSYTEGFPYVILESMAFGCPIIATDVGAVAEMLQNESGKVITAQSEMELSVTLTHLLDDRVYREKIGMNAHSRVMSVYTKDIIFKQYLSIWNKL